MHGLFTHEIQTDTAIFRHARGVSTRSGKEFHIYHEIIFFLDGDAELISEDLHTRLRPGILVIIPKQTYHQVIIHGDPQAYYRCILNFADTPSLSPLIQNSMTELKIIEADAGLRFLFQKLMDTAKTEHAAAPVLLNALLAVLLSEIASAEKLRLPETPQNELIHNAVAYINRNISQKLTVSQIAKACNTSESSLAHTFQREMRIPLHRYILKKRLITAYRQITAGIPATEAADRCGFHDYSGFYKQYKRMFGFPPSGTKKA